MFVSRIILSQVCLQVPVLDNKLKGLACLALFDPSSQHDTKQTDQPSFTNKANF